MKWTRLLKESHESEDEEVAYSILRYLSIHTYAGDTIEGIAQWWLLREWAERQVQDVERAVSLLVNAELVVKTVGAGQQPRYTINPVKKEEIERLLRGIAED